ncbi:7-carboxy-7-deazaguanine synthase [Solirubrobacter sp. CPCC 204708]|uniref:7-carboxy-7-deazaguanine synthase n=1 Tax=Solirubrobacter deserti TaxID=2282478 RepID=A0ABT4RET0_9ACTN|nr:7-carboxy-7-deazaguanine synthase [Solirubrobacter deserti]MBE2318598.1 7-carboxy-7-deazaguanine synthase [Solirubrobacter deserti]MDA0137056.1 7-carboxy-7-deazaguanine synthase [Solirubrobacter deserti]
MVKSIFPTLQGEGYNTGRPAVFCRFSGCNLWNGRESGRSNAICGFCDTDFVGTDGEGGGRFESPATLAAAIHACWSFSSPAFVVFTGGEPTLQLDAALIGAVRENGAVLAIETNGTNPVPEGVDWICVSPKSGAPLRQRSGDEIKIAWPQSGLDLAELERLEFSHRFLQPIDGPDVDHNTAVTIATCRDRPAWQLSRQWHKVLGIP